MTDISIGVFGGSGLYEMWDDVEQIEVDTPYGPPSASITVASLPTPDGDRPVAFLPRHGRRHELPPHAIDYRANVWALHSLGVTRVVAPCASGSLQPGIHPGDFVVLDQFVDRTTRRATTFFDGPVVNHVSVADPYCPELRSTLIGVARDHELPLHETGTVVVIEGPRFSTRAESSWFRREGWHVVNMTQCPEVVLARELGMCYSAVAIVTDYDSGVEGDDGIEPVTQAEVFAMFDATLPAVRRLLHDTVLAIPADRGCDCASATNGLTPVPPR
jgi:5'-methylthioadenosine phosphorylase